MPPEKLLPISDDFTSVDDYVESLLRFVTTSTLFQLLCGGVHILDFFTRDPSLFHIIFPEEWRGWMLGCDDMRLLDLLMREDLEALSAFPNSDKIPLSLLEYIKDVRRHSLQRTYTPKDKIVSKLPHHIATGMVPKKIHEVTNFAKLVDNIAKDIATETDQEITHYIDFGSGQNYLGRALASPPYNRHVIAMESQSLNIKSAKEMDVKAKIGERERLRRNKRLYRQYSQNETEPDGVDDSIKNESRNIVTLESEISAFTLMPNSDLEVVYRPQKGKGLVQYVEHVVEDGDLSDVVQQIDSYPLSSPHVPVPQKGPSEPRLMAISIHSCGNLSHHGIRCLLLNPSVHAIAIVGCCYNLLTERLGPPKYKLPNLRPYLRPLNAVVTRESAPCDPHGFPMSEQLSSYGQDGLRLNITARMMAVQAPFNWTVKETDSFFTRHFFRALLQKVFYDRGVVSKPHASSDPDDLVANATAPLIIGSLRKTCYQSFHAYLRGAVEKLSKDPIRGEFIIEKMGSMTDEEIQDYAQGYAAKKKELSIMWSLMAFSAGVVESLIVVDRWLYLREHPDIVDKAWVQTVFDYHQSPRNLAVVGIKKQQ